METPTNLAEPDPSFGEGIAGYDEAGSDTASELDDEYSHAEVREEF